MKINNKLFFLDSTKDHLESRPSFWEYREGKGVLISLSRGIPNPLPRSFFDQPGYVELLLVGCSADQKARIIDEMRQKVLATIRREPKAAIELLEKCSEKFRNEIFTDQFYKSNLVFAAMDRGVSYLEALLTSIPDKWLEPLLYSKEDSLSILQLAVIRRQQDCIAAIFKYCPSHFLGQLIALGKGPRTPLYEAVSQGGKETVTTLIRSCPQEFHNKLFANNYLDETPFMVAIERGADLLETLFIETPDQFICDLIGSSDQRKNNIVSATNYCRDPRLFCVLARYLPDEMVEEFLMPQGSLIPPLQRAISAANESAVVGLLESFGDAYGSLLLQPNLGGETPLMLASRLEDPKIVELLVKYCPKKLSKELWFVMPESRTNAIHTACNRANDRVAMSLVSHWPKEYFDSLFIDDDWHERTVFHRLAALESSSQFFELYRRSDAFYRKKLFQLDRHRNTVLHYAAQRWSPEELESLFEICSDRVDSLYRKNELGESPLIKAILGVNTDSLGILRERCPTDKVSTLLGPDRQCRTALHEGATHLPSLNVLLSLIPEPLLPNLFRQDFMGRTPLHDSLLNRSLAPLKQLINMCPAQCRDIIFGCDYEGNSALHFAVSKMNESAISILSGCNENNRLYRENHKGMTPLYLAIKYENEDAIKKLMTFYPNETAKDFEALAHGCLFLQALLRDGDLKALTKLLRYVKSEIKSKILNAVDCYGLKPYHYCMVPPYDKLAYLPELWPNEVKKPRILMKLETEDVRINLRKPLFARILERYPKMEVNPAEDLELVALAEYVSSYGDRWLIESLFEHEFKMNQHLPLSVEAVKKILAAIQSCANSEQRVSLHLALQTHSNLDEALSVASQRRSVRMFPAKENFFALDLSEQRELMMRAQVLRQRAALSVADKVVKDACQGKNYDSILLVQSLKLYRKTGVSGSKSVMSRLAHLFSNPLLSGKIREEAALAFAAVENDLESASSKEKFVLAMMASKPEQERLKSALVRALSRYHFTASEKDCAIADSLIDELRQAKSHAYKRAIVEILTTFPYMPALEKALEGIESNLWNAVEKRIPVGGEIEIYGDYSIFAYWPLFRHSRLNLRRRIAERIVSMNEGRLCLIVDQRYREFKDHESRYPFLKDVQSFVMNMRDTARHLPHTIFLPGHATVFRGINDRKGLELAGAAFNSLLMEGVGSGDLTEFPNETNGTWAKVGQVFTSVSLNYVIGSYYDSQGVLMCFRGSLINAENLRGRVRYQKEFSLHPIFNSRIRFNSIAGLLVTSEKGKKIKALAAEAKQTQKFDRVKQRNLRAVSKTGKSLAERVHLLNEEIPLKEAVESKLDELGLKEATQEEIAECNVRRQIVRLELLKELKGALRRCMVDAIGLALGNLSKASPLSS